MTRSLLRTYNPSLNKENPTVFRPNTRKDIELRLDYIDSEFQSSQLLKKKLKIEFLTLLSSEFEKNKEAIKDHYCAESGLSENRFELEFQRILKQFDHFKKYLIKEKTRKKETLIESNRQFTFKKSFIPIGPVLVLGSSNFPLAYSTAGGDTVSAICAGCPVIIKAHPFHLGTSTIVSSLVTKSMKKCNIPDWYFTHVIDEPNHSLTRFLIKSPVIKAVGFTGSKEVGIKLNSYIFKRFDIIPFFAEMGSMNPVVFDESALLRKSNYFASKIVHSINDDGGQFCTKPGLIFLPKCKSGESFLNSITTYWKQQPFHYAIHPKILTTYNEKLKILNSNYSKNQFFHEIGSHEQHFDKIAFVFHCDEILNKGILLNEIFGPCAHFVFYENNDALIKIILSLQGQLTGSYFGVKKDLKIINAFKKNCGRIIFNDVPTGVKVIQNMHHGGPFPASTDARYTSVGYDSINRFKKPVTLQNF